MVDDNTHLDSGYYSPKTLEAVEMVMRTSLSMSSELTNKFMSRLRNGSDEIIKGLLLALAPNLHTAIFMGYVA